MPLFAFRLSHKVPRGLCAHSCSLRPRNKLCQVHQRLGISLAEDILECSRVSLKFTLEMDHSPCDTYSFTETADVANNVTIISGV